jgi:hypothetical protein
MMMASLKGLKGHMIYLIAASMGSTLPAPAGFRRGRGEVAGSATALAMGVGLEPAGAQSSPLHYKKK